MQILFEALIERILNEAFTTIRCGSAKWTNFRYSGGMALDGSMVGPNPLPVGVGRGNQNIVIFLTCRAKISLVANRGPLTGLRTTTRAVLTRFGGACTVPEESVN